MSLWPVIVFNMNIFYAICYLYFTIKDVENFVHRFYIIIAHFLELNIKRYKHITALTVKYHLADITITYKRNDGGENGLVSEF